MTRSAHELTAQQSQPAAPAPDPAAAEEVRVAMALNGGVSLAVWMGGCTVELDAARRAHLGPEAFEAGNGAPAPPRTIYNALCRAFHRELVIDLMTGSSAGGINGALLAAAIHRGRRLHPDYIRDKWIRLGEFQELLRGLHADRPTSLMNGERFRRALGTTFDELLPCRTEPDEASPSERQLQITGAQRERLDADELSLSQEVTLEVTATDVMGQEHCFRDEWGEELIAREYRQRFRFCRPEDFRPDWLADAARASASFPIAFEPCKVPGERLALTGPRWLIDGGLLDNAPIGPLLNMIPRRPSRRKVTRYVCYVNADPPLHPRVVAAAERRQAARAGVHRPGVRVGKRATASSAGDPAASAPQLQDVLGYMVNLPRKATFVDHLTAIQRALGRSLPAEKANESLLALEPAVLVSTATALLPAYRSRRRVLAIEERLDRRPTDVRRADERVRSVDGGELPWIPTLMTPPAEDEWGWGVRPAQRILYLLLDLIRHASDYLQLGDLARRRPLDAARDAIYGRIEDLERIHDVVSADRHIDRLVASLVDGDEPAGITLCALRRHMLDADRDAAIREHVRAAGATVFGLGDLLGDVRANEPTPVAVRKALFGDDASPPFAELHFTNMLERTLSMEVVRRAFAADDEIDTDQQFEFAQITPCAPTLLLSREPLSAADAPATPSEKLTGTGWGHFAGFYRRSWRANDFMWGRLDAAVRIVDILVDAERAKLIKSTTDLDPAAVLARELWPPEGSEIAEVRDARRMLITEALTEAAEVPVGERYRSNEWRMRYREARLAEPPAALYETLRTAIDRDLSAAAESGAPPPALTRALCVRAAQFEVLRRELPEVVALSIEDLATGTSAPPIDAIDRPWTDVITGLRDDRSLPERLGARDAGERSSALMIRTATRSALVACAALRGTRLPLGRLLNLPGTLLLPAAGIVASRRAWAIVVACAFWFVAMFVAGRALSVDPSGDPSDPFAVIVTYLGVAALLSVCAVPLWRIRRGAGARRGLTQGGWLFALLATALVAPVIAAVTTDATVADVALQNGSDAPPTVMLVAGAASFGFARWLPGRLRRAVERDEHAAWDGPLMLWRLVPWAGLAVWAVLCPLHDHLIGGRDGLALAGAISAAIAPGVAAIGYVIFSGRGWSARRRARSSARLNVASRPAGIPHPRGPRKFERFAYQPLATALVACFGLAIAGTTLILAF